MGAWGTGPFDNDDAADWMLELEATGDADALLLDTLDSVGQGADASEATCAVAAIVWMLSAPDGEFASATKRPIPAPILTVQLRSVALRAIGHILAEDAEWRELWEDADEEEPIQQLEHYRQLLISDDHTPDPRSF
ncbi:DUF4259 domain-containing protein [Agrococcus baldri]|uniref:DUF4259 domain-containing protein n=1 Tax=Agrococcus baldri TaxID=153730 RepID=A0AA87RIP5_9MICO|nr:DUF4259 domain-containing protein [Agrococcus baldri]GEK80088.1 hypothetical protein ABA31_14390 [Agrococcus baldri]